MEDAIQRGPQRDLFHPDDMVTHKEDAANNFARGYCGVGRKLLDAVMNRIREKVEACSGLQVREDTESLNNVWRIVITADILVWRVLYVVMYS